jgi:DNA topoisomerase-1
VRNGRFGPYVNHGKINATLKKDMSPESVTLEEAIRLIEDKGGPSGARKAAPKKTASKAAPKSASAKKPAKTKAAAAPDENEEPPFEVAPAKKAAAKKTPVKVAAATKTATKKAAPKKAAAKKAPAKKPATKARRA